MRSKSFTLFCTTLLVASLLNACKGPDGPAGPQGTAGLQGAQGATGSKGDQGTANVVYSDWKSLTWSVSGSGSTDDSYYNLSSPTTTNSLFTKDAINTAAIFTYIKYNTYVETTVPLRYQLVERISSQSNVSHYYKIPGRTDTRLFDYGFSFVYSGGIGENYFSPIIHVNTYTLGTQIPELKNLTASAVQALIGSLPQFRHVIVYGSVKSGRLAAVNWKNYTEVKEALGLVD